MEFRIENPDDTNPQYRLYIIREQGRELIASADTYDEIYEQAHMLALLYVFQNRGKK